MEAASARYAARDRFAYPAEPAATPLQRYIQTACSPENFEPNLALCLEIADLINAKKGNAPREAAMAVVGYINHRNPNVSLLALGLLDICVKNCGYPFHLQISTKEFLNELVRRFPERPPVRTTRVQNRILELIEEWRRTICETSKYKEDLGFIRDMHRLLSYKGYMFPEIRREDAAVLNPSDSLKSAEEMEAEERAAQSAKLQELIRRGTPHDLQEANKLMKVMAGYDTRHKTDYRAKAAEEVGRIQQKAKLLEEMLQGYQSASPNPNEAGGIQEGDVYEELANALASAHPKIQRMCEEESEDHEAVAKLFEINDSIHRTIERYKLFKKGDFAAANAIPRGTLGVSGAGVKKGKDGEVSLIDFGGLEDSEEAVGPSGGGGKGSALENDLLGLSMGDGNFGEGGGIALGNGMPATSAASGGGSSAARSTNAEILAQFSQPAQQQQQQPTPAAPLIQQATQPQPPPQQQPASFDLLNSPIQSNTSQPSSKPATPVPPSTTTAGQQIPQHSSRKSDPFAALSSSSASATPPRTASPFQFQQSVGGKSPLISAGVPAQAVPAPQTQPTRPAARAPPPTRLERASTFDILGMGNGTMLPPGAAAAAGSSRDAEESEEWTFSSALPDEVITVTNSNIKTLFTVSRAGDEVLEIRSQISNNTDKAVGDLTFQLAVTKGYTLHLQPQSSRSLAPHQQNGITQAIRLEGVERGKGTTVKMRWRAGYLLGGVRTDEQGEVVGVGVP